MKKIINLIYNFTFLIIKIIKKLLFYYIIFLIYLFLFYNLGILEFNIETNFNNIQNINLINNYSPHNYISQFLNYNKLNFLDNYFNNELFFKFNTSISNYYKDLYLYENGSKNYLINELDKILALFY
jgi:hypothetical protein